MVAADVAHPAATPAWVVRAPSGSLSAALERRSGRLRLTVGRTGLRVDLGPAPRGILNPRRGTFRAAFTTPAGKRRVHRVTGRTLTVAGVKVLVARDGVAFRTAAAPVIRLPGGARTWLQRFTGAYERPYRLTRDRGRFAFPALLRSRSRYTLLTESGVARARVGHLRRAGRRLRVEPAGRLWRVAVTGTLADVVESDLPLALGRRSRVRRTGWIEPGRAAWSWLADHSSPRRVETQRRYVDLAARMGWEYVTVDEGWDPADVGGLVRYARERGVEVILWFDQAELDAAALDRVKAWGAAGVKADFFYSDFAHNIRAMDDIARRAAARRLVVAFHGCTAPRGLQRTWPNVLTVEAVRGAEHAPTEPRNDVDLALIRNPVGSMDYTPAGDPARAIAFESGLQHLPTTDPGPLLAEIPAAWDDTRLLAGEPDRYAVLARRAGARWFIGGLFAVAEPVTFPLPAGRYSARFADGSERPVEGTLTASGDFAAVLTPR